MRNVNILYEIPTSTKIVFSIFKDGLNDYFSKFIDDIDGSKYNVTDRLILCYRILNNITLPTKNLKVLYEKPTPHSGKIPHVNHIYDLDALTFLAIYVPLMMYDALPDEDWPYWVKDNVYEKKIYENSVIELNKHLCENKEYDLTYLFARLNYVVMSYFVGRPVLLKYFAILSVKTHYTKSKNIQRDDFVMHCLKHYADKAHFMALEYTNSTYLDYHDRITTVLNGLVECE